MLVPGAYPPPAIPGRLCDDWYMSCVFDRLAAVRETNDQAGCERIMREGLAYLTGNYLLLDTEMGEGVA